MILTIGIQLKVFQTCCVSLLLPLSSLACSGCGRDGSDTTPHIAGTIRDEPAQSHALDEKVEIEINQIKLNLMRCTPE